MPLSQILASVASITVATAVMYFYLRKLNKKDSNKRQTRIETSRQTVLEIKIPKECIPAIIGRQGLKVKNLEEETQTQIRFQEDSKLEMPERICYIKGKPQNVRLAEGFIRCIIANQPQIDTYEQFFPNRFISTLLGRAGQNVAKIQMDTHTKINIEKTLHKSNPNGETKVTIKGTADQIANALIEIDKQLKESTDFEEKSESIETLKSRGKSPSKSPVNEHNSESLISTNLDINEEIEVFVTSMDTPNRFYVQIAGSLINELDNLTEKMTEYYNQEENRELHKLRNITEGQLVVAKFSQDNRWYRAKVVQCTDLNEYEVFFVDFGDYQIAEKKNILELRTDFLTLRHQAIECSLANIKPLGYQWSEAALDKFESLTSVAQWTKKLSAKIKGIQKFAENVPSKPEDGNAILQVELFSRENGNTINIGLELQKAGLAKYENCNNFPGSQLGSSSPKIANEEMISKALSSDIQSLSDLSE